jgi:hypothetical protein
VISLPEVTPSKGEAKAARDAGLPVIDKPISRRDLARRCGPCGFGWEAVVDVAIGRGQASVEFRYPWQWQRSPLTALRSPRDR